jgi:predicted DNA-binding transcriptional regulator AlpA
MNIAEKDAIGIYEFCDRHGISRSGWYNLVRDGIAPRVMRVGARILISREAVVDWHREREQATRREGGGRGGDRRSKEAATAE